MYALLWAFLYEGQTISGSPLWEGTSKAAEGHLAEVCFNKAKEEEMVIAVNMQVADSSSKSFRYVFPDVSLSRVMLCGGHVGRSHANNRKEYKSKKSVNQSFILTKRIFLRWHQLSASVLVKGHTPTSLITC